MARLDWQIAFLTVMVWCGAAAAVCAQTPNVTETVLVEALPSGHEVQPRQPQSAFRSHDVAEQVVSQPAGPPPTPRHTGLKAMVKDLGADFTHLPSMENVFWAGVGGGLALAAHPFDDNLNHSLVGSHFAGRFFKTGEVIGESPTLLGAAVITYAVGRIGDKPKVSHLGMDLIESLVISEALTQTLKYATRRERPDHSGRNSFPSGHAADTFAFATALERHLGWKGAVPAYIFSSYVAISRLPANRHWLSDAVFGSAVGIIAGRTVTRHGREFPVVVAGGRGHTSVLYVHRWE
jgi:membrane-associated phospholipid phosphatase